MTVRAGMTFLVDLLSDLTNPGTEFTDDQLQDTLDLNKTYFKYVMLTPDITRTSQFTAIYVDYYIDPSIGEWFEQPVLGEINPAFYLESYLFEPIVWGTGTGQAQYNNQIKRITFNEDQRGKYYFLSGYSYDVYGAAAEIWQIKMSARQRFIDVKTDNHSLMMSQEYEHCKERFAYFTALSNKNSSSHFVRTDQGVGFSRNPMNLHRRGY